MNIYAVGDIHGCLNQLIQLNKKIISQENFKKNDDIIIYLGDYIDRGLKSKQVIDELLKIETQGFKTYFLLGNHEAILSDFLFKKKNNIKIWLDYGADQTFRSYGIELVEYIKDGFDDYIIDKLRDAFLKKLSSEHKNFFKNLKVKFEKGNYLFVHAGIDPRKSLLEQTTKDYLWSRSEIFFDKSFKAEKIIVHGHTPEENIVNNLFRINIDTGCYFTGKLSSVCLNDENEQRKFLEIV